MPDTKFAVVTSARTGSTWLIDQLNAQPDVSAYGELLLGRARTGAQLVGRADFPRFIEVNDKKGLARVTGMISYLNRLYRKPGVVGFKLMYSCLRSFPEVYGYFVARRIRIVHLERENLLDVLVSDELARLTGTSHTTAVNGAPAPRITVDSSTLLKRLERLETRRRQVKLLLRISACPIINVTYERLVASDRELLNVLDFFGIEQAVEFRSKLAKRGAANRKDSISNFEEVRRLLSNSRFEWMLD
jgi:hypothetical protein